VFISRSIFRIAALSLVPAIAGAQARGAAASTGANQYGNPEKHAPRPTAATISAADLMTRLYIFADDSMEGRNAPLASNARGNAYIVRELTRLGLKPAGDLGTYYQALPYVTRAVSPKSSIAATDGVALQYGSDFVVTSRGNVKIIDNAQVIYGGVLGDTAKMISAEMAANKFVIVSPALPAEAGGAPGGGRGAGGGGGRGGAGLGNPATVARYANAVGIATISPTVGAPATSGAPGTGVAPGNSVITQGGRGGGRGGPPPTLNDPRAPRAAASYMMSPAAAARLLGKSIDVAQRGDTGKRVDAVVVYDDTPLPPYAANVVAIIPGSDPVLKNEFVAIGAHNDHVGLTRPIDHDSARAIYQMRMAKRIQNGELVTLTPEQNAAFTVNMDSLRKIRPARLDSISNGADDDGSGSMAMLEIAEAVMRSPVKPKRSLLFVWHTAEEDGLVGSRWFSDNPTVPINSIVTQINMDMIGRGRAEDVPGGGPDYLGVVGANRLSSELGALVASVNGKQPKPLKLDDRFDRTISWGGYNNIYGRSDHANYSRYNIPIVFFFTGLHGDYHQVTDEPQYIDYTHYARITQYVHDLAVDVANLNKRPVVDKSGAPPRVIVP
jgi:hypothetical protein